MCTQACALLNPSQVAEAQYPSCVFWFAVVHSEGSDSGISAEVSLLEDEHNHAIGPNFQPSATAHAAFSPDAAAVSHFVNQSRNEATSQSHEMLRQASTGDGGHAATLHDAALETTGQLAAVGELVQRDSTATAPGASGHVGNAASETRHPLLLAALCSSQSLLASAVGSASKPLGLAASAGDAVPGCQLPLALDVGSTASGPCQPRPDLAAKIVSRSHSVGDDAAPHAKTDAGPDLIDPADGVQSSPAAEACLLDEDLLRQPEDKIAASEPMFGSRQYATVSASSRGPSPITQDPAEEARTTVGAHSSVADLFVAASLPIDAGGDGMLSDFGNKPADTATATDVLTPTSSIAPSAQSEHRQIASDAPPSGGPLRCSMSSAGKAAGLGTALSANSSTAWDTAHPATAGNHTEELRSSSGGKAAQALVVGDPVEESSRSSTVEAAHTDQSGRLPRLSRTGSAGEVSVSSHAQPERSVSPTPPADGGARLGRDPISKKNGQTIVSIDSEGATSLAAPADQGKRWPAASPVASSVKGVDSMETSLQRSGERAVTPVSTSLSQLGKDGGAGVIRHSVILTGLDPLDQWLYRHPSVLASLDYEKVKADLQVRHLS